MKTNYIIRFIFCLFITFSAYSYAYPWPISDFNTQHIVSGTFGECRGNVTRDHLHQGIDIDGSNNIAVYPVLDGTVDSWTTIPDRKTETLILMDNGDYKYTYVHLENVQAEVKEENYPVTAGETILGYINTGDSNHLHFTDGTKYGDKYNPLFHITPFSDDTFPSVDFVKVVKNLNSDDTSSVRRRSERTALAVRTQNSWNYPKKRVILI